MKFICHECGKLVNSKEIIGIGTGYGGTCYYCSKCFKKLKKEGRYW